MKINHVYLWLGPRRANIKNAHSQIYSLCFDNQIISQNINVIEFNYIIFNFNLILNSLEMNDKHDEPPQVADGYGVSVAYACLVDAVRAIQIEVRPDIHQSVVFSPSTTTVSSNVEDNGRGHQQHTDDLIQNNTPEDNNGNDEQNKTTGVKISPLHEQIINSSWHGLLTTFCPLIESWCVV